jgi:hypothetical protein
MVNVPAKIAPAQNANAKEIARKTIVLASIANVRIVTPHTVLAVNLNFTCFVNQGKE